MQHNLRILPSIGIEITMSFTFQPMTTEHARSILGWRYREPYTMYNADPANLLDDTAALLDPDYQYYALFQKHELVGYCCFGEDAQVRGGDYTMPALDVGAGMRPDLTGQGRGRVVLKAIVRWAERRFAPPALRVTVAAFNVRAQRACKHAGFRPTATFRRRSDDQEFVVMVRGSKK